MEKKLKKTYKKDSFYSIYYMSEVVGIVELGKELGMAQNVLAFHVVQRHIPLPEIKCGVKYKWSRKQVKKILAKFSKKSS